jgi:hypothetical protein
VAQPTSQPTLGELLWRRVRTLYEVDTGEHDSVIEDDLPSSGDAFPFHAAVDLRWRVTDPVGVVERHLETSDDVVRALRPELKNRLRVITREFDVEDSAAAEVKVNQALASLPIGEDLGLRARCWVRLTLEELSRAHATDWRQLRRKMAMEDEVQKLRVTQDQNNRTLLRARMSFYQEVIAAGDISQFAIQLAQNPEEVAVVMEAIRTDRDANRRNTMEFFTRLADSGLIEKHQIGDVVDDALKWLNDSVGRVIDNAGGRTGSAYGPSGIAARGGDLPSVPLPGAALTGSADLPSDDRRPGE